ncbi:MAG: monovalent cation/H(+) antiporter subunit G [Breznakibacter sp.]
MAYFIGIIIILAALLVLVAGIGILRFGDIFSRMHAVTKVSSLALIILLLAVNLYFLQMTVFLKTTIIFFTVVFMSPIAAHLLAKVTKLGNFDRENNGE